MLWIKAFHIIFLVSWFAGIFYLPRLFVNHAMTDNDAVKKQLEGMERRLYRFITPFAILTLIFGLWMYLDYARALYQHMYWLDIKLILITLLYVYHFYCGKIIRDFKAGKNTRSHIFYRWFNEFPVLVLFSVVILVVVKPV
ncbi:MAG: CopD family protein [Gammaproteobacteria bacterium]|nr:CopD family protein [Gammaproteobacteria bacterium]